MIYLPLEGAEQPPPPRAPLYALCGPLPSSRSFSLPFGVTGGRLAPVLRAWWGLQRVPALQRGGEQVVAPADLLAVIFFAAAKRQ